MFGRRLSGPSHVFSKLLVLTGGLLFFDTGAEALDSTRSIRQFAHESYTQRSGHSIPPVRALTQTLDGYLWTGTDQGLFRFDGVRFRAFEEISGDTLPEKEIGDLAAGRDGSLWVAAGGSVVQVRDHRVVANSKYTVPRARIVRLAVAANGGVWAGANRAGQGLLAYFNGTSWNEVPLSTGTAPIRGLLVDAQGDVWVLTSSLIRNPGKSQKVVYESPTMMEAIAAAKGGGLWMVGADGLFRYQDEKLVRVSSRPATDSTIFRLLEDEDGGLWMGTITQGLYRQTGNGLSEINRRLGLSGDSIRTLLEDREGNVWAGTQSGLDRFSDTVVARVTTAEGLSTDLVSAVHAAEGGIWVGTRTSLEKVTGAGVEHHLMGELPAASTIVSLLDDLQGKVWVGTVRGLLLFEKGRFRSVPGVPSDVVVQIAKGTAGSIWLLLRTGVYSFEEGKLRLLELPSPAGGEKPYAIGMARNGELWIGYSRGAIAVRRVNGTVEMIRQPGAFPPGLTYGFVEDDQGGMWVAEEGGLSRYQNGQWADWKSPQTIPAGGVQDLVWDAEGMAWLRTSQGLIRVTMAELNRVAKTPGEKMTFQWYGLAQGMRLQRVVPWTNPRVSKTGDGRLWFSTDEGVAVIDAKRTQKNPTPPPVRIEGFVADGQSQTLSSAALSLPRLTRDVRFEYTALSLTAPALNRFRYQLEGIDTGWVNAGNRREAFYSNLQPGTYRFRVIAANNDGAWSDAEAVQSFTIPPAFHQTAWFYLLVSVTIGASAYGFHRYRLRQMAARQELVLQERSRIARELHDRLLQGFTGATWQLSALASEFPNTSSSRGKLEHILDQMDRSMVEARESITSLRLGPAAEETLTSTLTELGRQLVVPANVQFEPVVEGACHGFPKQVEDNLAMVAREAMVNALLHGKPSRICLKLQYGEGGLRMEVEDDGIGFHTEREGTKEGHWGLVGMRERVKQMGGELRVESQPGQGCKVVVQLGPREPA